MDSFKLSINDVTPIGAILAFMHDTIPTSFLACDGTEYNISDYPKLFQILGTKFGGNGTDTFKVPDLRECAIVGTGENSTFTITDHDVYNIGEFKDDQVQSHQHIFTRSYTGSNNALFHINNPSSVASGWDHQTDGTGAIKNNTGRAGSTTHGKQIGAQYGIKAL